MAEKNRAKEYEDCPGCTAADVKNVPCDPHNAAFCPIAWSKINRK